MPKKICNYNGCNHIIPYTERYCSEHKKDVEQKKKESYKIYDNRRKQDKEWKFYKTKIWLILRNSVLTHYNNLDLFAYYVEKRIAFANTSHHIIEVRDDWNKRLEFSNQFPCSGSVLDLKSTHSKIHSLYKKDKQGTQELLRSLLKMWEEEFGQKDNI